MKRFFLLGSCVVLLLACSSPPVQTEQIIYKRIAYIFKLKSSIGKYIWPGFDEKAYDVPLIYYTAGGTFVANPTEKFLSQFQVLPGLSTDELSIFKTDKRVDSIPFHMATGITMGSDSLAFDYYYPFMRCSGYEETKAKIKEIKSTEEWITMVIHEYFHGFQFRHKSVLDNGAPIMRIGEDTLKVLYKSNPWYKAAVDQENHLLIRALATADLDRKRDFAKQFFEVRDERREKARKVLHFNLDSCESYYETLEGTARYVEATLMLHFSRLKPDSALMACDTSYHAGKAFVNFKIEDQAWIYKSDATSYWYATGYNLCRLLDELSPGYKKILFNEPVPGLDGELRKAMR